MIVESGKIGHIVLLRSLGEDEANVVYQISALQYTGVDVKDQIIGVIFAILVLFSSFYMAWVNGKAKMQVQMGSYQQQKIQVTTRGDW